MTDDLIEKLETVIRTCFPDSRTELHGPSRPKGSWFLYVWLGDYFLAVEWRPEEGFGVTANPDAGFGEGPEEVHHDLPSISRRVIALLSSRKNTVPPNVV